jgi:transcriptional regulator with XRE-family HTH domain
MTKKQDRPSDQIRSLIEECGLTRYEIFKATGIDQATLSKFSAGKTGLSMKALDVLGEFLRFEITMKGPRQH